MSASISVQVDGYKSAIRELSKLDPELKKQVGRDIRAAIVPIQNAARAQMPTRPLRGWGTTGRLAYTSKARTGIKADTRQKRRRDGSTRIAALSQKDPAGAIYDIAGRKSNGSTPSGQAFIAALNAKHGHASRAMWPTVEKHRSEVNGAIEKALGTVADALNRKLR